MNMLIIFLSAVTLPLASHNIDQRVDYEMVQKFDRYCHNDKGWDPLNYAIEKGDYDCALVVCDHVNRLYTVDDGFNPLNRLLDLESRKMNLKVPPEHREKISETAKKLISKLSVEPNLTWTRPPNQPKRSSTTLVYGCHLGLEDLVNFCLRLGADRRYKHGLDIDQENGLPLKTAIESGHLKIVNLLIKEGADLNKGSLAMAATHHDYQMLDLLLQAGADIDRVDLTGIIKRSSQVHWSPGRYASEFDELPMLKFLLSNGRNPNAKYGNTSVLQEALSLPVDTEIQQTYKTEVVRLLLQYGAVL